jgi:hypothetical protein
MAFRHLVKLTRFQQRFAWNTANPQASPTKRPLLLNTGNIHTQLCGSNRSNVSTRPTADDNQIMFRHFVFRSTLTISIEGVKRLKILFERFPPNRIVFSGS